MSRESFFKTGKGREFIKKHIKQEDRPPQADHPLLEDELVTE